MSLYENLLSRKQKGEELDFSGFAGSWNVRKMYIYEGISDELIGELYGVTTEQVKAMRKENGIEHAPAKIRSFLDEAKVNPDINAKFKDEILNEMPTTIAKAVAHFAFRNGPIEDMHADSSKNVTENDMKILNKFIHDHLTYVFTLILEKRWIEFNHLVRSHWYFGSNWDEPDVASVEHEMRIILEQSLSNDAKRRGLKFKMNRNSAK